MLERHELPFSDLILEHFPQGVERPNAETRVVQLYGLPPRFRITAVKLAGLAPASVGSAQYRGCGHIYFLKAASLKNNLWGAQTSGAPERPFWWSA